MAVPLKKFVRTPNVVAAPSVATVKVAATTPSITFWYVGATEGPAFIAAFAWAVQLFTFEICFAICWDCALLGAIGDKGMPQRTNYLLIARTALSAKEPTAQKQAIQRKTTKRTSLPVSLPQLIACPMLRPHIANSIKPQPASNHRIFSIIDLPP
jgi:hypothetical protein